MDAGNEAGATLATARTTVKRGSDRELVVTRTFNAPARIVFEAWTTPEILKRWWAPKSMGMTLVACETDVRAGGRYRYEFSHPNWDQPVSFFGKYIDVTPPSLLSWTNEEDAEGAVTTATFEETGGKTLLTIREVYPSKAALDGAIAGGQIAYDMEGESNEQFEQLDALLPELIARAA